jgi:hypothetical protein
LLDSGMQSSDKIVGNIHAAVHGDGRTWLYCMLDKPACSEHKSEKFCLGIHLLMDIMSLALVTEHVFLDMQEPT